MQGGSLPAPTKRQELFFQFLKLEFGCIACRIDATEARAMGDEYDGYNPPDIHHELGGGTGSARKGHDDVVPLCIPHHKGDREFPGWNKLSIHKTRRAFIDHYGPEADLTAAAWSAYETAKKEGRAI